MLTFHFFFLDSFFPPPFCTTSFYNFFCDGCVSQPTVGRFFLPCLCLSEFSPPSPLIPHVMGRHCSLCFTAPALRFVTAFFPSLPHPTSERVASTPQPPASHPSFLYTAHRTFPNQSHVFGPWLIFCLPGDLAFSVSQAENFLRPAPPVRGWVPPSPFFLVFFPSPPSPTPPFFPAVSFLFSAFFLHFSYPLDTLPFPTQLFGTFPPFFRCLPLFFDCAHPSSL